MLLTLLKFFLGFVVLIAVLVGLMLGGSYVYLSPEEPPPKFASPSSIREVSTGVLVGSHASQGAHQWLGIPYAQPPVNNLRWKAPRPAMPWNDRLEALNYGKQCVQLPVIPGSGADEGVVGDEDCLVLNIWAPTFAPTLVPKNDARLPVMVWIHGGGNSMGSGGSELVDFYNGAKLAADHNVIVVTLNYRMGPIGWFAHRALRDTATSPEDQSGNYGTLDLIAALAWVQSDISAFGGDPANVTIFGESAGGQNVLSLMASPIAKGLFHRAIVQSGGLDIVPLAEAESRGLDDYGKPRLSSDELIARWLIGQGRASNMDEAIVKKDAMESEELSGFLRSISATDLYSGLTAEFAGMISSPAILGDGYVLPDMSAREVFSDPENYIQVPIIIGSNRDESSLFMAFSPDYVNLNGSLPIGIKDPEAYRRDIKYSSDNYRAQGVDAIAQSLSTNTPDKVFAYRFDADDWRNLGLIDFKELFGAAHALEVLFVFGYFPNPLKLLVPDSTSVELELLSNAMMSYWAEFAYNGNPGTGRFGEESLWAPWREESDAGHLNVLDTEIDGGIRMEQGIVTTESVREQFFADQSFKLQSELCLSYFATFRDRLFDENEFKMLGDTGCYNWKVDD